MRLRRLILLALWLAIALAWMVGVALAREREGWEWPFRMTFGLLMLALFLVTEPLKGRMEEGRRKRIGDGLTVALLGLLTVYLGAKVIQAVAGGALGTALVLAVVAATLGGAGGRYLLQRRRARRTLEDLVLWCRRECESGAAWTREVGGEDCFGALEETRPVDPDAIYGALDKPAVRGITAERLREIPGIGPAELAVIDRFLEVPRLPGITLDVARRMHAAGLHSRRQVAALSEADLTRFKGIGPVKARKIRAELEGERG